MEPKNEQVTNLWICVTSLSHNVTALLSCLDVESEDTLVMKSHLQSSI